MAVLPCLVQWIGTTLLVPQSGEGRVWRSLGTQDGLKSVREWLTCNSYSNCTNCSFISNMLDIQEFFLLACHRHQSWLHVLVT